MRTTIDLDDELLRTAKGIAQVRGQTLSKVISELAWNGLRPDAAGGGTRNGFPVLPSRPGKLPVTPEHVAEMLDREDIDVAEAGR
jgi:hypothetical protein